LLPFDVSEATYLLPALDAVSTADLIALRARQLAKRDSDLQRIHDRVVRARFASVEHFEKVFRNTIASYDFQPGALVLVRNSRVEVELNRKSKPRYLGPMIVLRRTKGGSYILSELDGAVSRLRFAAFRLIPYYPRSYVSIPITRLVDLTPEELDMMTEEIDDDSDGPVEGPEDL
jgi:hypothetical protein